MRTNIGTKGGHAALARRRTIRAALAIPILFAACTVEIQTPPEVGYLAVIVGVETVDGISAGSEYSVSVEELSGFYDIAEEVKAAPNDTLYWVFPVSSYDVIIDGVPEACHSRTGRGLRARISRAGNTSVARFNFVCSSLLAIVMNTDGEAVDSAFVWTVDGPAGTQYGVAGPADTVRLDGIVEGEYTVELGHLADNCALVSDGFRRQTVEVVPPAPRTVYFRIRCSDPERGPRFIHHASSIRDGVSAFYFEAVIPESNPAAYAWNVTDCLGTPIAEGAGVTRDRLYFDRTRGQDTVRIVGSMSIPPGAESTDKACTALILMDRSGNTTGWSEERNRNEEGAQPSADLFNVVLSGDSLITTLLGSDPDGDLAGAFVSARFVDGTLGQRDGRPDEGIYNVAGYLPPFEIPALRLGTIPLADLLSVSVDLVDRNGNFIRATDTNFIR